MKYYTLIFAIIFFSCTNDSSQNATTDTQTSETEDVEASKVAPSEDVLHEEEKQLTEAETEPVEEIREATDASDDENVRATFLLMVEAINNATTEDAVAAFMFLDKDYVFKGRNREAAIARLEQQFTRFKSEISELKILQLESSGKLAYLIASFKRSISDRETGETKIDLKDKVGIFILRKDSAGDWKLLVQKTDSGYAHWYYMPEAK